MKDYEIYPVVNKRRSTVDDDAMAVIQNVSISQTHFSKDSYFVNGELTAHLSAEDICQPKGKIYRKQIKFD